MVCNISGLWIRIYFFRIQWFFSLLIRIQLKFFKTNYLYLYLMKSFLKMKKTKNTAQK